MTANADIDLPKELGLFPLPRAILLPRAQLPLNVFEPRYMALVDDALSHDKMIGIVQYKDGGELFKTGCMGRIVSYSETDDGRYLVTLKGICRFDIDRENDMAAGGFRKVTPSFAPYKNDLQPDIKMDVCKDRMMQSLRAYLDKMNMFCDQWDNMKEACCERLVSTLCVVCPFERDEKQALLEAKTLDDRARMLCSIMEIAVNSKSQKDCGTCH